MDLLLSLRLDGEGQAPELSVIRNGCSSRWSVDLTGGNRRQALVEAAGIAFLEGHGSGSGSIGQQRLLQKICSVTAHGRDLAAKVRQHIHRECIRFQNEGYNHRIGQIFLKKSPAV